MDRQFFDLLSTIIEDLDVDTSGVGMGGHYVLGPLAEALLSQFINAKHRFDVEETALIQLPRQCRVRQSPQAQARVVATQLQLTR
jgi:hypothetical protein